VTSPPPQEPASSVKSKASSDSASGKGGNVTEAKPLVQHYATIELAEKVIDSDSRLVNTLAHEFCHLANFMVSGVRDQPHGVSFKAWAEKVTTHLRTAPDLPLIYRAVEVTTKHSYVINHKYLWICAGQSPPLGSAQAAARAFLALDDDPGCGAEYGRHSRSIDPDKHRCGKCKGLLVQVRPKVKVKVGRVELDHKGASPRKGKRANSAKRRIGSDGGLGENKDGGDGGSNDKLDGLKNALEDANLSD
jgi:predicted SprT family Zn-dependent metalloprotease